MANRHLSRSIMLQTLFEWDFLPTGQAGSLAENKNEQENNSTNGKLREALNRNLKEFGPGLEDDNSVFSLIEGVLKKQAKIDEIIEASAPDWPIDKISIVDRNILRIGLYELLFGDRKEVPPKVAINEAIELAKTFGGENSGKFVNGVLGAVYKEIGEPGKEQKSKANKNKKDTGAVDITKLRVDKKGGALVYTMKDDKILFALVHDVFGYWTISKGSVEEGENEEEATVREIKEEIGLDITVKAKLGENEYVATHPSQGKSLKKVVYFLAESEYKELELEKSGGLDNARWFELSLIPELRIYNDIIPIIEKAIKIISFDQSRNPDKGRDKK